MTILKGDTPDQDLLTLTAAIDELGLNSKASLLRALKMGRIQVARRVGKTILVTRADVKHYADTWLRSPEVVLPLAIEDGDREPLEQLAAGLDVAMKRRAKAVLRASQEGVSVDKIAGELTVSRSVVYAWLRAFLRGGVEGLAPKRRAREEDTEGGQGEGS